ncbi:hypothetical protein, partial [Escherichia coli]
GPKTSIICSPMTSLKTSIKTITYLSDTGCLEIQGASLVIPEIVYALKNGTYDPISSDITSSVNTWFGDLFDDNGDLIIHKQDC